MRDSCHLSQPQSATPLQVSQYCSTATPTQNCMYQSRTWQVPSTKVVSHPQSTTLLAAQNYKYQVPSTAVVSPTVRNTTERCQVTTTKYHRTQSTVKCTVTVMQYIQCRQTQKNSALQCYCSIFRMSVARLSDVLCALCCTVHFVVCSVLLPGCDQCAVLSLCSVQCAVCSVLCAVQ